MSFEEDFNTPSVDVNLVPIPDRCQGCPLLIDNIAILARLAESVQDQLNIPSPRPFHVMHSPETGETIPLSDLPAEIQEQMRPFVEEVNKEQLTAWLDGRAAANGVLEDAMTKFNEEAPTLTGSCEGPTMARFSDKIGRTVCVRVCGSGAIADHDMLPSSTTHVSRTTSTCGE